MFFGVAFSREKVECATTTAIVEALSVVAFSELGWVCSGRFAAHTGSRTRRPGKLGSQNRLMRSRSSQPRFATCRSL